MKIAFINGSPKAKDSNSGRILNELKGFIDNTALISDYSFTKLSLREEEINQLKDFDALVFAFPLYVDAVPSHLLGCLIQLEGYFKELEKKDIKIYALINCGFYEGQQNKVAMEIMENWCEKTDLIWGQGLCIGTGMMLGNIENVPSGHGPKKDFGIALKNLGENISNGNSAENLCITANFPRFLYKISGNYGWVQAAKKNGLKKKDLYRRL